MGLYLKVQLGQSGRRPVSAATQGGVAGANGKAGRCDSRICGGQVRSGPVSGPIIEEEITDVASCRGGTEACSSP